MKSSFWTSRSSPLRCLIEICEWGSKSTGVQIWGFVWRNSWNCEGIFSKLHQWSW